MLKNASETGCLSIAQAIGSQIPLTCGTYPHFCSACNNLSEYSFYTKEGENIDQEAQLGRRSALNPNKAHETK